MRIGLAFRLFFKVLFDAHFASLVAEVLQGRSAAVPDQSPAQRAPSPPKPAKKAAGAQRCDHVAGHIAA